MKYLKIIAIITLILSILPITSCSKQKQTENKIDDIIIEKYIDQFEIVEAASDEFEKAIDNTSTTQEELILKMNKYVEAKRKLNMLEKGVDKSITKNSK